MHVANSSHIFIPTHSNIDMRERERGSYSARQPLYVHCVVMCVFYIFRHESTQVKCNDNNDTE